MNYFPRIASTGILTILLWCTGIIPSLNAQILEYSAYTLDVQVNTIAGPETPISIVIDGELQLSDSITTTLTVKPVVRLVYTAYGKQYILAESAVKSKREGNEFQIRFDVTDKEVSEPLLNPKHELYLLADAPVLFEVKDAGMRNEYYQYALTVASLKQRSQETGFKLEEEEKRVLEEALGGFQSVYFNKFETGWNQADSDTGSNQAYVEFSFLKEILPGLSVGASGLLNTLVEDEFAHFELRPFMISSKNGNSSVSGIYQNSLDGDTRRLLLAASHRTIINNFVDITGSYNRLRVKPMIEAGIAGAYYTTSPDSLLDKQFIIEPFVRLWYDIPLLDNYLIRLDVEAYTRSNSDLVFDLRKETQWNAGIDLAYGVGKTAKILGSYMVGTNGITNETDGQLMLGILIDFLDQ